MSDNACTYRHCPCFCLGCLGCLGRCTEYEYAPKEEFVDEGVDEAGWDVEPGDEIEPVVQAVGRLLKVCRESAGMSVPELAAALGYGEDMIRKIEREARIPRPECLDRADQILRAQGHLPAFMDDMRKARYPKKVRQLAELEERSVEMLLYSNHNIHGLLQTEEYARALLRTWRPAYSPDELERMVTARCMAQVGLRALARAGVGIRPGRGDAAPPDRGHNGAAPAARTHAGGGEVAVRGAAGDADRERKPPGNRRACRGAEVRGRYGDGAYRR
ncbi:hypothetical protein STENM223S_09103 [Streptomyces tendae]